MLDTQAARRAREDQGRNSEARRTPKAKSATKPTISRASDCDDELNAQCHSAAYAAVNPALDWRRGGQDRAPNEAAAQPEK